MLALTALAGWLVSSARRQPEPSGSVPTIGLVVPGEPAPGRVRTRIYMRIPWGAGPGRVVLERSGAQLREGWARVLGYWILDDGGVWIVDTPKTVVGPRAQRFDAEGRLKVSIALGPGTGVPYAAGDGELYHITVMAGTGRESVTRRGGRGKRLADYPVPAGQHLTAIALSADRAVFGRLEVWERDPTDPGYMYRVRPALQYLGRGDTPAQTPWAPLAGYSFVPTGEMAQYERQVHGGPRSLEMRSIAFMTSRDTISRSYALGTQLAFVGGDAAGNVYCELQRIRADPLVEPTVDGRATSAHREVIVFAKDGRALAVIRLPWHPAATSVVDPIKVDADGRVFIAGADDRGFVIRVAEMEAPR